MGKQLQKIIRRTATSWVLFTKERPPSFPQLLSQVPGKINALVLQFSMVEELSMIPGRTNKYEGRLLYFGINLSINLSEI